MDKTEKIVSAIPSAAELEQLAELHKAMGDHTRMRILWHLTQKEYCVSDLAKEIGVTESALSHQLRALRIVRLVRSRKEGKKVIYSLQEEHIGWVLEETYAHSSVRCKGCRCVVGRGCAGRSLQVFVGNQLAHRDTLGIETIGVSVLLI